MDRTAFIFVLLIMALALFGIVPTGKEEVVIIGEARTYDAIVTFDIETDVTFLCDVADDTPERTKGLMDVKSLGRSIGMLFIYDEPVESSFWMKSTYIDLDIIFISEDLEVMKVHEALSGEGKPDNELIRYSSGGPALYVLEINMGLSREYGIGPGTHVDILL